MKPMNPSMNDKEADRVHGGEISCEKHSEQEIQSSGVESQESEKKLGADILASFAGEIFLFVASLLLGILTARFLGADGKGRFNVIYYAVSLLSTVFSLRIQRSITYTLSKNKDLLGEIIATAFLVGITAILCVGLFSIIFHNIFYQYLVHDIEVQLYILVILSASVYLWNLLIALFAGLQQFKTRSIFMGSSYLLKSGLVILSLGFLHRDLNHLFLVTGTVETVVYTIMILYLLPRQKWRRISPGVFQGMMSYSIASFPGMVSDLITLRIDVFFVNFFAGASQVGIYTVAISIANILLYVPTAVKSVLMPYIASQGSKEITPKLSRLLILIQSVLSVGLIPVVWFIVKPFFGDEFGFSRILFLVLLPGSTFWAIFGLLTSDLEGRGLPWKASSISMASALATIILDIALIPVWGALGAALASTITYAISMLLAVVLYQRITGVRMNSILIPRSTDIRLLSNLFIRLLARVSRARADLDPE
jgi:O-antigen/teichoic acid export membrane protein